MAKTFVVTLGTGKDARERTVEIEPASAPDAAVRKVKVRVGGQPAKVESARQNRLQGLGQRAGSAHGPAGVSAPMPGRVIKLLAKAGDAVKAGQGLVIVEAMKMENEVRAPRDGQVAEVRVKEGQAVEAQEVMLTLQ
jgi:biotin carboxyl carrier protein